MRLDPITRWNWRAAGTVRVKPGQLAVVAGYEPVAFVILAKAAMRVAGFDWHPLAAIDDDRIVGVLAMVDEGSRFALYHLVIDGASQGQGLGTAAVLAALEWARARGASSVRLTVDYANVDARRLYARLGFVVDGDFEGELGMSRGV